jgi:cobalt-zinc-cadmium efflux system membrane fusion protein
MNLKNIYIILISLLAFFGVACKQSDSESPAEEEETYEDTVVVVTAAQAKAAGIVLGKVEEKKINGNVKVNGVLDVPPQQLVSISAPMGGFLKSTVLLQGSRVSKGQVIATMENLDFVQLQQDYLEAKNQFEFSKNDYERQLELAKENVNSQKTLQQSKSNYKSWEAKYNGLKEKLKVLKVDAESVEEGSLTSTINLYSPINGYVTEVNVNIGKFVNPTDVLFEIVDTEHLHAELIVFEKDIPKLKIGQKVRFTLANETDERIATVHLIGREIRPDRTIRIHCHIDKEDNQLLPGMYLTAVVETGGAFVSAIVSEAVIDYQGKKYLFVADGENHNKKDHTATFDMVEVGTGNYELGYTELKLPGNFDLQKQIVIKGAYSLLGKLKNKEEVE